MPKVTRQIIRQKGSNTGPPASSGVFSFIPEFQFLEPLDNFPGDSDGKESEICLQCRILGFNPFVQKIPWRRERLLPPLLLPGQFHGQRSLAGYSPWGCKRVRHD